MAVLIPQEGLHPFKYYVVIRRDSCICCLVMCVYDTLLKVFPFNFWIGALKRYLQGSTF